MGGKKQVEPEIRRVEDLPPGIDGLATSADAEGFPAVETLRARWHDASNRFDRHGEMLCAAWAGDRLVGICGLNIDPYVDDPRTGRVRHLYVLPMWRRNGVATALLRTVIRSAVGDFRVLRLRTDRRDADAFYVAVGFQRVEGVEACTHVLPLPAKKDG